MAPLLMVGTGMAGLAFAPTTDPPPLGWAVASTAAGGLVASAYCLALARRRGGLAALGFRPASPAALGLALALVGAFFLLATAWSSLVEHLVGEQPVQAITRQVLADPQAWSSRLALAYGVLLAPLVEELLFRGFLLVPLVARIGPTRGLLLTALMFGVLHAADPWTVPLLVVFGLVLGALRLRSGSLLPPLLLHLGNNLLSTVLTLWG